MAGAGAGFGATLAAVLAALVAAGFFRGRLLQAHMGGTSYLSDMSSTAYDESPVAKAITFTRCAIAAASASRSGAAGASRRCRLRSASARCLR